MLSSHLLLFSSTADIKSCHDVIYSSLSLIFSKNHCLRIISKSVDSIKHLGRIVAVKFDVRLPGFQTSTDGE